jgi:hypothetical protein
MRKRTQARAEARIAEKQRNERRKLVLLQPGGAPDRPIAVSTASLVENTASALGCGVCGGALRLGSHEAKLAGASLLRVVTLRCAACSEVRIVYMRITVLQ